MVSMDLVLNVFISHFFLDGKDSNAFLTCASFFNRGGSQEQLSNTNCLNFCLDVFFSPLEVPSVCSTKKRFNQKPRSKSLQVSQDRLEFWQDALQIAVNKRKVHRGDFLGGQVHVILCRVHTENLKMSLE